MILPEPSRTFTVGSMTWVIGANGVNEIVEAVQNHPAPIMPTSTTSLISVPRCWVRRSIDNDDLIASIDHVTDRLAECQLLVDSVLDWYTMSNEVPAPQDCRATTTERSARPRRLGWQDSDLVITVTLEGHTVQHRPLLDTGLRLADYKALMDNMLRPYPLGLVGMGYVYQDAIHHLFIDHAERDYIDDLY